VGVPALIVRCIGGAGNVPPAVDEGRLDREHLVDADHPAIAAVAAHQFRHRYGRLEFTPVTVEVQDALASLVVVKTFVTADLPDQLAALRRQPDDFSSMPVGAARQTVDQEPGDPQPLIDVEARPKQERRVAPEQPFENLARRGRIGPRLRMAHGHLPAIGEARPQARCGLPVDDAHGLAGTQVPVGGGDADNAGTKNDDIEVFGGSDHAQAPQACRSHPCSPQMRAPSVIGLRVSSRRCLACDLHRRREQIAPLFRV